MAATVAPHDIAVHELGSGRSRLETARQLGIRFDTAKRMDLEDGIHATRVLFPRMWFDAAKCKVGLGRYRRAYNRTLGEYTERPVHDHASRAADALRTLGIAHRAPRPRPEPSERFEPIATGPTAWMAM